jgi:hypothetical protein
LRRTEHWARSSDLFTGVRFPEHCLDVAWKGLKIFDPGVIEEMNERKRARDEAEKGRQMRSTDFNQCKPRHRRRFTDTEQYDDG